MYSFIYIASMKESYQLELKTMKTILKVRRKQVLWAEKKRANKNM